MGLVQFGNSLMYGVADLGETKILNLPAKARVRIRQRHNEFTTFFVKTQSAFTVHYGIDKQEGIELMSPHARNTRR